MKLFFNPEINRLNYSNIYFYDHELNPDFLIRDFSKQGKDQGFYFNWLDNQNFLKFDLIRYFCLENTLRIINETSTNYFQEFKKVQFFGKSQITPRCGLPDDIVLKFEDSFLFKEINKNWFQIGDLKWATTISDRFHNDIKEREIIKKMKILLKKKNFKKEYNPILEDNLIQKEWLNLIKEFQSNRLLKFSKDELLKNAYVEIFAVSNQELNLRLKPINWYWSNDSVSDEENYIEMNNRSSWSFNNTDEVYWTGSFIDQEIVNIWNIISNEIKDFFHDDNFINYSDEKWEVKQKKLHGIIDQKINKIIRNWKKKTRQLNKEFLDILPHKIGLYCWNAIYSIRVSYEVDNDEDYLLRLIEKSLNKSEEDFHKKNNKYTEQKKIQKWLKSIKSDTRSIKSDTKLIPELARKLDIMMSEISEIKSLTKDTNESIEKSISQIISSVEKNHDFNTIEDYIPKVTEWFKFWDKIEENTKTFMPGSEWLYDNIESSDFQDFSPFVLYYCRALENELLKKIFLTFHDHVNEMNDDELKSLFVWNKEGLNEKKLKEYDFFYKTFKTNIENNRDNYNLGFIRETLSILPSIKKPKGSERFKRSPLIIEFNNFLSLKMRRIENDTLERLRCIIKDYRNKSAHVGIIDDNQALHFYNEFKLLMNKIIEKF